MSTLPRLVSGFTVIPVAYARSTHILYARAHRSKSGAVTLPEGRTLFLVNVPVDATDREISLFFQPCGTVERVVWDRDSSGDTDANAASADTNADSESDAQAEAEAEAPPAPSPPAPPSRAPQPQPQPQPRRQKRKAKGKGKPAGRGEDDKDDRNASPPTVVPLPPLRTRTLRKTGGLAHVVFLDAGSVEGALALASTSATPRPWPSSEEPRGLAHYMALYDAQRPPLDVVKAHADSWMARFEFELEMVDKARKRTSAYRKGEAIVDEDGFTLVARGGAYGRTLGGGVAVASKAFEMTGSSGGGSRKKKKKKKEPKEKETFYGFQKAEKQRKALLDLRKNFEADKERIEKLKESRRFKPY